MFATNCRNTYKTICVSVTAKKPERICGKLRLSYPRQTFPWNFCWSQRTANEIRKGRGGALKRNIAGNKHGKLKHHQIKDNAFCGSPNPWEDPQELSEPFANRFSVAPRRITGSKETPPTSRDGATSAGTASRKELCTHVCLKNKHQTPFTCDKGQLKWNLK